MTVAWKLALAHTKGPPKQKMVVFLQTRGRRRATFFERKSQLEEASPGGPYRKWVLGAKEPRYP